MVQALTHDDDKIRGVLLSTLKALEAPSMIAEPCDDSETVDEATSFSPNVILDWEELKFDFDPCAPHKSASSDWTWTAKLDWPCRVSTSRYLDSLLENPIMVPGDTSPITGGLISPNRTIRLLNADNHPRPTQGSPKGSGLTLTFSVNRPSKN